jgi:hypothetical protein
MELIHSAKLIPDITKDLLVQPLKTEEKLIKDLKS